MSPSSNAKFARKTFSGSENNEANPNEPAVSKIQRLALAT